MEEAREKEMRKGGGHGEKDDVKKSWENMKYLREKDSVNFLKV